MRLDDYPRVPLLFGPSPVHPLKRLSAALGGAVEIWAKREDCNSGIALGGNKVRKLEYLAADALAQGCDTLVSIGGVQSNHTRQVTGVANYLGLQAVTVQEHWVDDDNPVYGIVGNIQLTRIMGGDIRLDDAGFAIGIRDSWKAALESVEAAGGKPSPCWSCKKEVRLPPRIRIDRNVIMLNHDTKLYPHHVDAGKMYDFGDPIGTTGMLTRHFAITAERFNDCGYFCAVGSHQYTRE